MTIKISINKPSNTISFVTDEITVGSDKLCLKFFDMVLNLEDIKTLEFEIAGKKYTYVRR